MMPDGSIEDSTEYVKVGFVVGNSTATSFMTQSRGGYDFILNGIEFSNVTIYTKSEAIDQLNDDEESDPTGPQKPDEDPEYTPEPAYRPDYSLGLGGGSRYGGIA